MSGLVLDASVALSWVLLDEGNARADAVLARLEDAPAHVPQVWPLEVANGLRVAERRGRIREFQVRQGLEDLLALPVRVEMSEPPRVFGEILALARSYGLSVYDAAYLDLAMRLALPLASLDENLARAARESGVGVV